MLEPTVLYVDNYFVREILYRYICFIDTIDRYGTKTIRARLWAVFYGTR